MAEREGFEAGWPAANIVIEYWHCEAIGNFHLLHNDGHFFEGSHPLSPQNKKTALWTVCFLLWRRERDSNPRYPLGYD